MDNCCLCKLRDLYRAILNFENQLEKLTGLNLNEAMLLCLLSDGNKRLSGTIAEEMGLSKSNTSKVIASLEKQAYIKRKTCESDSRCQYFSITSHGKQILEQVHCNDFCVPHELEKIL